MHLCRQYGDLHRAFGDSDHSGAVQDVVEVQAAVGTKIKNTAKVSSANPQGPLGTRNRSR